MFHSIHISLVYMVDNIIHGVNGSLVLLRFNQITTRIPNILKIQKVESFCYFRCRASSDCPGFLVNYENESCYKLDFNTDDYRRDLVPSDSRVNFFEKICLTGGKSRENKIKIRMRFTNFRTHLSYFLFGIFTVKISNS